MVHGEIITKDEATRERERAMKRGDKGKEEGEREEGEQDQQDISDATKEPQSNKEAVGHHTER